MPPTSSSSVHELLSHKETDKSLDLTFDGPLSSSTTACHLAVPSALLCCIVSLQNTRLTLVRLREGIATLFAHALYLANLANCLLELLHSGNVSVVSEKHVHSSGSDGRRHKSVDLSRTLAYSPGCCISESLARGGTSEGSTCAWRTSTRNHGSGTPRGVR
jgi:hypothetical protein